MKVRKLKTRIAAFGLAVLMGISTLSSANAFAAEQTGSEQQTEVQASEQAVTSQKDTSVTADDITKAVSDDTFAVELIEQVIFSLPWSQKSFADACRNQDNVDLVCEADGVIAGYCGMWTVLGEGNITNMAVSPDYRRCGIAQRLMQSMENYGDDKNVTSYFLEVRQSNLPAIALYEKMGYKNIGIRKGFYEKPVEDAVIMSKNIG